MVTIKARVYGRPGHRIALSFAKSVCYDWSTPGNIREVAMLSQDYTGTNDYCLLSVKRNTKEECLAEISGQVSDGLFENCRVGNVEIIAIIEEEI